MWYFLKEGKIGVELFYGLRVGKRKIGWGCLFFIGKCIFVVFFFGFDSFFGYF